MTFLDNLQSHKGGLVRLKTQLFWYDGRGWDNNPGRICLLLDAAPASRAPAAPAAASPRPPPPPPAASTAVVAAAANALLLIDGSPQWIWIDDQDIDLLVNDPSTN